MESIELANLEGLPYLENLPETAASQVVQYLSLNDVIRLRATCRIYNAHTTRFHPLLQRIHQIWERYMIVICNFFAYFWLVTFWLVTFWLVTFGWLFWLLILHKL
jgi:hypothetical protein